jgi:2-methylcitrate dehydratase PrpD
MTEKSITRRVAEFVTDAAHDRLPADVVHGVRRAILDSIGVSVAGTRHPASAKAIAMVTKVSGGGPCHIVGSPLTTDPLNAALVNGVTAHVLDWDDTILPTRAHLSAALLPPLIAAGEIEGWTIAEIIPAFAIGFEFGARINHAVYPSVHLRGWQGTGMAGGAAAAAAIGRMMGLDETQIVHALGIAATNASGLIATFGSMSKPLNIGRAGASGLQSAWLAADGSTSNEDIFGAGKFLEMFDEAPRHNILTDGLGERWSILENGYKPYPCGFVAHAMIDAVRNLRAKVGPDAKLKSMRLRVSPESTHLMGNPNPTNELEAKFSLLYDAAVAWVEGHVTPAAFEEEAIADPRYRAVMALTEIVTSREVAQDEAFADAEFADGTSAGLHVPHARGTLVRPLTDQDLREKFDAALALGGIRDGSALAKLIMEGDAPVGRLIDGLNGQRG